MNSQYQITLPAGYELREVSHWQREGGILNAERGLTLSAWKTRALLSPTWLSPGWYAFQVLGVTGIERGVSTVQADIGP